MSVYFLTYSFIFLSYTPRSEAAESYSSSVLTLCVKVEGSAKVFSQSVYIMLQSHQQCIRIYWVFFALGSEVGTHSASDLMLASNLL